MKKKSKEINIISGWYGPNNFGDEAILEAIVEQLEKDEGLIPDSIVVFSLVKEKTRELFPTLKVVRQLPNDLKELIKCTLTLDIFITLYYLFRAKRLYVGGGGFLSDWQSNNFGWLIQIILAKISGSKCMLWGVGIGPFNGRFSTTFTSWCFRNFIDSAYVRDEVSHKELSQKLRYEGEMIVKVDPVALMSTHNYQITELANTKRIVFIPAYYFKNKKFKAEENRWDNLLTNFCKSINLLSNKGYVVDIVFFQPSSEIGLRDEIQQGLAKLECHTSYEFHFLSSHRDAFRLMSNSQGIVSFRLHGNIMAHALNKPFLPIIYHFKSEEFLSMVDKPNIEKIMVGDGIHLRRTEMDFSATWEPEMLSFLSDL